MAKLANIRGIVSLVLAASLFLISGCMLSSGKNSVSPAPTPTPAAAHSVAVTWDSSPSPNVEGYRVYRSQVSGGPYAIISPTVAAGTGQFTDTAVLAGQTYFYVITSVGLNGLESAPSTEVSTTVPTP